MSSLGEPVGNAAWIVRVYVKPFIDWIWGGCVLMALGGLLAATDRRYRGEGAAHATGGRSIGGLRLKSLKFLIPLALFVVLARISGSGPQPQSARGAVAADRQAGADIHAGAPGRSCTHHSRATKCSARCGCSTCGPRGARRAAKSIRLLVEFAQAQAGADLRPELQGHARRRPMVSWPARQPLRSLACSTRTAVSASILVSTACPRPSSSTARAWCASSTSERSTPEVLRTRIEPLLRQLNV